MKQPTNTTNHYVNEFLSNKAPRDVNRNPDDSLENLFLTRSTSHKPIPTVLVKGRRSTSLKDAIDHPRFSERSIARIKVNPEYDVISVNPIVVKSETLGDHLAPPIPSNSSSSGHSSAISGDSLQDVNTMKAIGNLPFSDASDAATYYDAMSRQIRRLKRKKLKEFQQLTRRRAIDIEKEQRGDSASPKHFQDKKQALELREKRTLFAEKIQKKNREKLLEQKEREREVPKEHITEETHEHTPAIPGLPLNKIVATEYSKFTNIPKPSTPEAHPLTSHCSGYSGKTISAGNISPTSERSNISSISARSTSSKFSTRTNGTVHTVTTTVEDPEQIKIEEECAREIQKQRYTEQRRFLEALREQYIKRVREQNIQIPPLCNCGSTDPFEDHARKCCVNCPFYRNPELYARQLASYLSCLM